MNRPRGHWTMPLINSQRPPANAQGSRSGPNGLALGAGSGTLGVCVCSLPVHLRTQLELPRRVAHRRDAGEVPGVEEIQRAREVERRRVRQVEGLGADLELPLARDPELLGNAEIDLA